MAVSQAFASDGAATLAASTTSASVALPASTGTAIVILNQTASLAFCQFGMAGVVASAASPIVVPPGQRVILEVGPVVTTIAAILVSGTGAIYCLRGNGFQY
jgi:hypothetical protein